MLSALLLFGCAATPAYKPSSIDEMLQNEEETEILQNEEETESPSNVTILTKGSSTLSSDERALDEIKRRYDLALVDDDVVCKEEAVYCFRYDTDLIVKLEMDETQKKFYDLMKNYQLPKGGVLEDVGSDYEYVVYENGYKFYTKNKIFFEAPNHSTDEIKPTEDQYFSIVMMRVELAGASRISEPDDYKQQAQSSLDILNSTKEFVKDDFILTWIEDCSAILQKVLDAQDPDEGLYLKAMEKLNYLGNVVQVHRYENGNL